jgi:hypothetical protein
MAYSYTKKNWLPRVRQYPDRFKLKDTSTGAVVATYDLERVEGTVSQVGTPMSPTNLNSHEDAMEFAVNAANLITNATNAIHRIRIVRSLGGL